MSEHTPGPWRADWRESESWASIDARRWRELATVNGNENEELHEQGLANARLIAAAPDLYEALTNLVARLENDDSISTVNSDMQRAYDAIDKVIGQTTE